MQESNSEIIERLSKVIPAEYKHIIMLGVPTNVAVKTIGKALLEKYPQSIIIHYFNENTQIELLQPKIVDKEYLEKWYQKIKDLIK